MPAARRSDIDEITLIIIVILKMFDVRDMPDIPIGDIPFADESLQNILMDEQVRETVKQRVEQAQAEGRALPLPSAGELADMREQVLEQLQRRS